MQYSLLMYQTDAQFAARTDPIRRDAMNQAFGQYVTSLHQAGVLLTTLGIEPATTAHTMRAGTGGARTNQGPYAATAEQLGGVCVIDVPDHEAALAWAGRMPFEHCAVVEVRPTRVVSLS